MGEFDKFNRKYVVSYPESPIFFSSNTLPAFLPNKNYKLINTTLHRNVYLPKDLKTVAGIGLYDTSLSQMTKIPSGWNFIGNFNVTHTFTAGENTYNVIKTGQYLQTSPTSPKVGNNTYTPNTVTSSKILNDVVISVVIQNKNGTKTFNNVGITNTTPAPYLYTYYALDFSKAELCSYTPN
jgi:hypothetical protein